MGTTPQGINGPIVGKVGTVHGSSRRGKHYVKGPHKKRTTNITEKEESNRTWFSVPQYWLKPITEFVREGFKNYNENSQGFVAAKSYLLRNAMEGIKPDVTVNPALAKVSFGTLPSTDSTSVEFIAPNKLKFTWDTASSNGASPYDQAMLLAYDIDNGVAKYNATGQFRFTGEDTLTIPKANKKKPKNYHIYLAFVAKDRSRQSDSLYLGVVTV